VLACGRNWIRVRWYGLQSCVLGECVSSEPLNLGDTDRLNCQDARGQPIGAWNALSIRVIDLDLTADVSKLVAIGLVNQPSAPSDSMPSPSAQARLLEASAGVTPSPSTGAGQSSRMERRIAVYDIESRQELWCDPVLHPFQIVDKPDIR